MHARQPAGEILVRAPGTGPARGVLNRRDLAVLKAVDQITARDTGRTFWSGFPTVAQALNRP
jgi:hypothetical protein